MDSSVQSEQHTSSSSIDSSSLPQGIEPIASHPLRFTGSGREYFRVWIVNILLSIITLGFYTPWARWRTATYFYGHTLVAGSPLEFTGSKRRMFNGFLIFVAIMGVLNLASRVESTWANMFAMVAGMALGPFFWRSAMRFRTYNTQWRGLRLVLGASWKEVYRAFIPMFIAAGVMTVVVGGLLQVAEGPDSLSQGINPVWTGIGGIALLVFYGYTFYAVMRVDFNLRSLLMGRTHIGDQACFWRVSFAQMRKIWFTSAGWFFGLAVITGVFSALAVGFLIGGMGHTVVMAMTVLFMTVSMIVLGYFQARIFLLTWNHTGVTQIARFQCALSVKAFVALRFKNLLLTGLTLGLYRPIARVSEYRMRLESVTLFTKGDINQLSGTLMQSQGDAFSEALADSFGLDLVS